MINLAVLGSDSRGKRGRERQVLGSARQRGGHLLGLTPEEEERGQERRGRRHRRTEGERERETEAEERQTQNRETEKEREEGRKRERRKRKTGSVQKREAQRSTTIRCRETITRPQSDLTQSDP